MPSERERGRQTPETTQRDKLLVRGGRRKSRIINNWKMRPPGGVVLSFSVVYDSKWSPLGSFEEVPYAGWSDIMGLNFKGSVEDRCSRPLPCSEIEDGALIVFLCKGDESLEWTLLIPLAKSESNRGGGSVGALDLNPIRRTR